MKDANCVARTEERADGWFYVVCSVHGDIFAYNRVMVKDRGLEALQKEINEAWEKHEPLFDPIKEAPIFNMPLTWWN